MRFENCPPTIPLVLYLLPSTSNKYVERYGLYPILSNSDCLYTKLLNVGECAYESSIRYVSVKVNKKIYLVRVGFEPVYLVNPTYSIIYHVCEWYASWLDRILLTFSGNLVILISIVTAPTSIYTYTTSFTKFRYTWQGFEPLLLFLSI